MPGQLTTAWTLNPRLGGLCILRPPNCACLSGFPPFPCGDSPHTGSGQCLTDTQTGSWDNGLLAVAITVSTPVTGPFVIGPGAAIQAQSDLLALANPPYHWTFTFTAPDNTFTFQQLVVVPQNTPIANTTVLWQDLDTPGALVQNIHANPGDSIRLQVEVKNDLGQQLDTPLVVQVPWQPVAWLHANQALWNNNLVSRIASGGNTDQLDRIESAVYQVFPHA